MGQYHQLRGAPALILPGFPSALESCSTHCFTTALPLYFLPGQAMSSRTAFIPDHFHYAHLVAAIVCCHCYSTLFFPTKGTELNEMLHYQCVFLCLFFFSAIGTQLSSLTRLKRSLIFVIFPWWKYLYAINEYLFDLFNKINKPISLSLFLSDLSYILNKCFCKGKLFLAKELSLLLTSIKDPLQNNTPKRLFETWLP